MAIVSVKMTQGVALASTHWITHCTTFRMRSRLDYLTVEGPWIVVMVSNIVLQPCTSGTCIYYLPPEPGRAGGLILQWAFTSR